MSAIIGIFYRNGLYVSKEQIQDMNNILINLGQDGSDIWIQGSVALGQQMLLTTPESLHEKLPFEENDFVITSDARIDNRDELSKLLAIEDKIDIPDSYFILKSYEMWVKTAQENFSEILPLQYGIKIMKSCSAPGIIWVSNHSIITCLMSPFSLPRN